MKRFHLNLRVSDLAQSTRFYTELLGAPPTVDEADYKKWLLDDPYINLSIETECGLKSGKAGIAHVGIQAGDEADLDEIRTRIAAAEAPVFHEGETQCCYSHSFKSWTRDPDGIVWEAFFTDGQRRDYGAPPELSEQMQS